jgi:hypothetical protein
MTQPKKSFSQCKSFITLSPIHSDIQFKRLGSNFSSIYTLNSQAIGFEFLNEECLDFLTKVFENEQLDVMTNKNDEFLRQVDLDSTAYVNSEKEIYFICCLETKLDKDTKRGAILKSISIGTTKLVNLNVFKPVALFLLEEIFKIHTFNVKDNEKLALARSLIESAFNSFNELDINK